MQKIGADYYLNNIESDFDIEKKKEIAFLIEVHEIDGAENIERVITSKFPNITKERKEELILLAQILQDADRLDMLRYDIEKPDWQRFNPNRLNNPKNTSLISAVIELNTRQAIKTGYLPGKDFSANDKLLKLYFGKQITLTDTDEARRMIGNDQKNDQRNDSNKKVRDDNE